ncbi:MAG: hypothetical protein AB7D05_00675 [Mangrovibacterium sp.]
MRETLILKKRILQYLRLKGITKYEFYRKTGISNGILSQKNGLSEDNLLRFLSYYSDINYKWLLTGEGEILSENEKQESRSCNQPQQYDNSNELKMIKDLAAENALLKKENEELKDKKKIKKDRKKLSF